MFLELALCFFGAEVGQYLRCFRALKFHVGLLLQLRLEQPLVD